MNDEVCRNICNLDSWGNLSWNVMLKRTEIELKLLTGTNMYNFVVRNIRESNIQCSKRHMTANNKYVWLNKIIKLSNVFRCK